MADLQIHAGGIAASIDALRATAARIDAVLPGACLEAAEMGKRTLAAATPRSSRERSIAGMGPHAHMQDRWLAEPAPFGAVLGNDAPYGPYLITGTRYMRANAALAQAWGEAPARIATDLVALVDAHLQRP